MHGLKKFSLTIVLSALLSVSAHAVDEDGTFTITIQGPEEEQIQQVAPRQTAPRRANVATNVQRRQPTRTVDATNNPNRQARTTPRVATTTQSNATTTTVAKTSNIPNFANEIIVGADVKTDKQATNLARIKSLFFGKSLDLKMSYGELKNQTGLSDNQLSTILKSEGFLREFEKTRDGYYRRQMIAPSAEVIPD